MSKLRIVKRAPSRNYESHYEPSIALINHIGSTYDLEPEAIFTVLVNRGVLKVVNPFGTEVFWSMEEK